MRTLEDPYVQTFVRSYVCTFVRLSDSASDRIVILMVRRSSVIPWKASVQLTHIISDEEEKRWDVYVQARGCTVTDLSAWRHVVQDAYGIRSWFLAATRAGGIKGTLGLYEVSHPIFGHYLATAVFGNDGGLHFDDSEARDLLIESARKLADERDVDYLLIRTRGEPLDGFVLDDHYRTAMIDLSDGPEKVWSETLKAKTRNQIRRGIKERFTVSAGDSQLLPFFKVFHEHMRFLGSPAHSLRFYEAIRKRLTSVTRFLVARDGRRVVGGALLFQVNGTAMNYHTVALNKYSRRCPNYLLYWKMIEESCRNGCARFDMGRSEEGSSVLSFKRNWNPVILRLSYNYYLRKIGKVPYLDPRNPRYRLPISIWKKLPLFVTRSVGPRLISGLA